MDTDVELNLDALDIAEGANPSTVFAATLSERLGFKVSKVIFHSQSDVGFIALVEGALSRMDIVAILALPIIAKGKKLWIEQIRPMKFDGRSYIYLHFSQ
jgi:hypothetical protein